ncbi:MAG: YcxB family protein [Coriobacteriia bacterium]
MNESPAGRPPESPDAAIEFKSQVTEAGYRRVLMRVALRRLRWVLPFLAFFGFAALGRGDLDLAWFWLAMGAGTMLIVVAYALWVSGSPSASKAAMEPVGYRADDEGLHYESADGRGLIEWSQVRRWEVAADHYLLYVGAATYLLVPVHDLCLVDGRDGFESTLRSHVVPRRWWRRR